MEFIDKQGKVRIKIYPPDRVTDYEHIHLYNKQGQSLSSELSVVRYKSIEAHIRVAPDDFNFALKYKKIMGR